MQKSVRLSKCSVGNEEKAAVGRVLDHEFLGMGREVQAFEEELKQYLQTPLELIAVNTGTSALHLAVEALDLDEDAEILLPSITYVASFQAVTAARAVPVACDVEESSFFIDLHDAEKRISTKTRAIMPVHYASDASRMEDVYAFAKKHRLRVIEDAAHSIGGSRLGKKVGAVGDILCFSFDGIKNMTCGEGGAVVTSDVSLAQRIRDARLLGVEKDTENRFKGERSWVFDVRHQGYRYHMSDIMAALGRAQLQKLDRFVSRRQALVQRYLSSLQSISWLKPLELQYSSAASHIFVVRILGLNRDDVARQLKERGVATGVHYFPNHLLSYFKTSYPLPQAEKAGEQMMTLPLHVDLREDEVDYVCQCLKDIRP